MKLAPEELAIILGLVQQYKAMPEEKREAARAFAYNRAIWQGNQPHDREVNKQLYNRFLNADAELRAEQTPTQPPAFNPPTMQETVAAARATVAWLAPILVPVAGIAAVGYIAFQALMGFGAAVSAFFASFGGWIIGGGLVLFCLSALVGGNNGEAVEVEKKEEKRAVNINIVVDGEQKNVNVG